MGKLNKPKFKPEICRVKLNQEQAVLTCSCYDQGQQWVHDSSPSVKGVGVGPSPKGRKGRTSPLACMPQFYPYGWAGKILWFSYGLNTGYYLSQSESATS